MGLFLHSFVLVPYHSWRISHAKHHAATGHLTRDEVFVPRTLSQRKFKQNPKKVEVAPGIVLDELLEDAPIYRLGWLLVQQVSFVSYRFLIELSLTSFGSNSSSDGLLTSSVTLLDNSGTLPGLTVSPI